MILDFNLYGAWPESLVFLKLAKSHIYQISSSFKQEEVKVAVSVVKNYVVSFNEWLYFKQSLSVAVILFL